MKTILGIAVVVIISLVGSRNLFKKIKIPLLSEFLYLTGTEYILVGFCLGQDVLSVLDRQTLIELNPLLYLCLGWIGFYFGVQLDTKQMVRFPKQYLTVSMLQASLTILITILPFLLLLKLYGHPLSATTFLAVGMLGIVAAPTGQSSLSLIQNELKLRRSQLMDLLIYIAGVDACVALFGMGVLFSFAHAVSTPPPSIWVGVSYLSISVVLGTAMGWLFHILTRLRCSQEELVLYIIGLVVFSAGAAFYLKISPLFVTMISGFLVANVRGAKTRAFLVLSSFERPFYIILLIISGALINLESYRHVLVALTFLYILLRISGKALGGYISSVILREVVKVPQSMGFGLTSQGGIAIAMAASFHYAFEGGIYDTILILVLSAIVINELLSPFLSRIVIRKAH